MVDVYEVSGWDMGKADEHRDEKMDYVVMEKDYTKLEAENQKLWDALEYCSEKLMKGILGYEPQAMMLERIEQALEDK